MVKFGTGGWRGIIGDEFTKHNIQLVGKSVVLKIQEEQLKKPVVIGYDRRFLSREGMIWLAEVLASNNIKVFLIDSACPTPLIMYYIMAHDLDYGLMVTASHNPSLYNGIKVIVSQGRDASEEVTNDLQNKMEQIEKNDTTAPIRDIEDLLDESKVEFFNPINEYLDNILKKIDVEAIKKANLKIAIDPLFGVSLKSLNTIFATCRCDISTLHTEHDTLFAGKNPAPDENTMKSLQNYVTDYGFDLGIATDGDGDRIGLIDDKGEYIDANEILCVLYYYFLKYKGLKTPIVKNLCTTSVLDKIAESYGQQCIEVPVGFKHISSNMTKYNAYIGGESSGGLTVMGHINGKDAIYSAALLVETIAKTGKKLSELMQEVRDIYGFYTTIEENLHFRAERKLELIDQIYNKHDLPDFGLEIEKYSYIDGAKVFFKDGGWLTIRFSGTEPLLRIFCEMEDCKKDITKKLCNIVKEYYHI